MVGLLEAPGRVDNAVAIVDLEIEAGWIVGDIGAVEIVATSILVFAFNFCCCKTGGWKNMRAVLAEELDEAL